METKKYKIYLDRIFVLVLLIGAGYFLWFSAKQMDFVHVTLISFIAICCFIILYKNPPVTKKQELGAEK